MIRDSDVTLTTLKHSVGRPKFYIWDGYVCNVFLSGGHTTQDVIADCGDGNLNRPKYQEKVIRSNFIYIEFMLK